MAETTSLFSKLLKLYGGNKPPLENYFTEIVVRLFLTSPEILYAWLKRINLIDNEAEYSRTPTIKAQKPLEDRRRPDIQIELSSGAYRDVIFIESKIVSEEHNYQLREYAKYLNSQQGVRNKILFYVTRDDDPKDKAKVLEGIPAVRFEQERWYTLQRVLQDQPKNLLLDEIIIFMNENGMGLDNKLTQEVWRVNLSGTNLSGATLSRVDLSKANLSGVNLANANLSEINLVGTNLRGANLKGANLYEANLSGVDLCGADLRETNLRKTRLCQVKIDATTQLDQKWRLVCEIAGQGAQGRDLYGADLSGANLYAADMQGVNLSAANLKEVDLSGANLRCANLSQTDLSGTALRGTILGKANLNGTNLRGTDLRWVDLSETDLRQFDFRGVKLPGVSLAFAQLYEANFSEADLSGADLHDSEAQNVQLNRSNLSGADLRRADLRGANLSGANLCGADLHWANLFEADMRGLKYDHFTIWPEGFTPPADAQIL